MAKHRSSVFTVVRECVIGRDEDDDSKLFGQPSVVGVYFSLNRAEEIAARFAQEMVDSGFYHEFRFSVQVSTYYDE